MIHAESEAPAIGHESAHILVIDDDLRLQRLLIRYLRNHGYRVTAVANAESAARKMKALWFDVLILDVMMPGKSGLDFARELEGETSPPILMLTARAESENRIAGLEAGVEDYLAKPFEPRELLLRIRRILRRRPITNHAPGAEIALGACLYNPETGDILRDERPVRLTYRERRLLEKFLAAPGRVFSRGALTGEDQTSPRAVDLRVNRLRRKIEKDPRQPLCLQTVRGRGYMLRLGGRAGAGG